MKSCIDTIVQLSASGYKVEHQFLNGCSNICVARTVLAYDFLRSDADTLLFIDADLSWDTAGALRLVESPHDVIAGVYPAKQDDIHWLAKWREGQTRLLEADGLPGGFLKITRRALEKIAEKFPELHCKYRDRDMTAFFENAIVDGELRGEDYAFCWRWQQCGGKAFLDPDITFEHYGRKAWQGNLQTYLTAHKRAAA